MSGRVTRKTGALQTADLERLRRVARAEGLKLTHQRLEIFQQLLQGKTHPSAEDVYLNIRKKLPTVSLDTVYRTLATFERLGVISRVHILDHHSRFDINMQRHHHFVCSECKRVEDFSWPALDEIDLPDEAKQFGEVRFHQIEVRGVCEECLKKQGGDHDLS